MITVLQLHEKTSSFAAVGPNCHSDAVSIYDVDQREGEGKLTFALKMRPQGMMNKKKMEYDVRRGRQRTYRNFD